MPTLEFDIDNVLVTEFGVGRRLSGDPTFTIMSTNPRVKDALQQSARTTWQEMQDGSEDSREYSPSEKFSRAEYVHLPLGDGMARTFRELHESENLQPDANALSDVTQIFCYFARFTDGSQRRMSALRIASQFKSLGQDKNWLVSLTGDGLTLIEEPTFKISLDFDVLIDANFVHILHPNSFESLGELKQFILEAVPKNVAAVQKNLPFVDLQKIEEYAARHSRAARYLASINAQGWARGVDKLALKSLCEATGVEIAERAGQILVSDRHVMGFLEVLDRRRYEVGLVANVPEQFKASSRQRIGS